MAAQGNRTVCVDPKSVLRARQRLGLSRERLAEASQGGLSVATLKRVEQGAPVYLDTARRLATLLHVSLKDLLGATAQPEGAASAPATLVVMPFDLLGPPDDDLRFFADGLTEDLITRVGRQWFPVIARSSSFSYAGTRPNLETLRGDLGADFAVEGSVRRSGSTLRVTARLDATATGQQVWANTYDRAYADILTLQDALVSAIVGHVDGAMTDVEVRRQLRERPSDLHAWELGARGSWHFHRMTKDANLEARGYFERAVARDPMLPYAWYSLALTHQRAIINQWSDDPAASLGTMRSAMEDFARWFPNEAGLRVVRAYSAVYAGDRTSAVAWLREAIALDPNLATAYSLYGQTLAMAKEPDEAIEQFEIARRLSPRDVEKWALETSLALCHFVAERPEAMLEWAKRAVQSRPNAPFPYGTLAVALATLGDLEAARVAARTMIELEPRTSLAGMRAIVASTAPDIASRYVEALSKAGVPR